MLPDESWDPMFRRSAARRPRGRPPRDAAGATAADVLAWDRERGEPPLSEGLTPEREAELLAADRRG